MTNFNELNLHYIDNGKGIPIIFIHPPVLSSVCFIYQLRELSKYFRVIAFDIRGHGKSAPSQQPLTYPLIVEDIKQLMNHLKIDKAFFCGYSTGSSIVLEFMLTYPDRSWGGVLVGGLSEVTDMRLKNKLALGAAFAKFGAIRALALSISWSNSNTLGVFWKTYQDAKKSSSKNVEEYYRYSLKYNCSDQLGKIVHPVLLIYGKKDKGFHRYGNLIHQRISNSKLMFIPNVKHQIPTKAATELNTLIKQFVNEEHK
jgi:pimeloyl-ACP methyl ester carboxylesterase